MSLLFEFNYYDWLMRLLFTELGVLLGMLTKGNIELPYVKNDDSAPYKKKLHLGAPGQLMVGFIVSFVFQLLGYDVLVCFFSSTGTGSIVNFSQRLLNKKVEQAKLREEVKVALKKALNGLDKLDAVEKLKKKTLIDVLYDVLCEIRDDKNHKEDIEPELEEITEEAEVLSVDAEEIEMTEDEAIEVLKRANLVSVA